MFRTEKLRCGKNKVLVCTGISAMVGILLIIGGVLVIFLFRDFVDKIIKSEIPLREGSTVTESWLHPPVRPLLQIYFFNTTNPADFLRGEKPVLKEVGPYVYEEKWDKVDVEWEGGTVKYRLRKLYRFRQDLSYPLQEEDTLTLPNVPMFASVDQMKTASRLVQQALGSMLEILRQEVFNQTSVRDVLWGYDHPLIKLGNDVLPPEQKLPFDKFGFFVNKNGSTDGVWEAKTGMEDIMDVGQVVSFDGKTKLDTWEGEDCNRIRGTDGSIFHPEIQKNETIYIFNKDLCQSLPFQYSESAVHHHLTTYRFVPPSDVFATPKENPRNRCFCPNPPCPPSGLFNLSRCLFGFPLMLSWPHFFQGDPSLLDTVEGLHPQQDRHQFQLDILPSLGVGMRAVARTQINLVMKRVDTVKQMKGIRDIIYPVFWFQEGIEEIEDETTLRLLQTALYTPEMTRSILYPSMLVLGSLLVLAAVALLIKRFAMPPSTTVKVSDISTLPLAHSKPAFRSVNGPLGPNGVRSINGSNGAFSYTNGATLNHCQLGRGLD